MKQWLSGSRLRIVDKDGDHVDFSFGAGWLVVESVNGDETLITQDEAVYLAREILNKLGESNG
jgi:hypothetical protein